MIVNNEKDFEFRHGDSGPKYFMKGPHSSFGICRVLPGQIMDAHKHAKMEENFYVLEGSPTFIIDGKTIVGKPGDFIHMEPGEVHKIVNESSEPCLYVINTSPFFPEGDKILVED